MCAIARAFMAQPKLLMLDEPSLGLAPVIVDQIFETIVRVHKEGTAILLVEQNVLVSLEIAQRAYVIESGCNYISGTSEELRGNDEIRKAYLGI
jgi:branched-chain amino acid transport system ATP-binding protein